MLERENIAKEVDMDYRGVVEVIANEVDDEKVKETAAEISSSNRTGWPVDRPSRPDVHNVHKLKLGQPVGRPTEVTQLSVGHPVDRPVDW